MSIEQKPTPLQFKLMRYPIRKYIESTYNVTVERNDTIGLKPPYIILGNHVNNWDPITFLVQFIRMFLYFSV